MAIIGCGVAITPAIITSMTKEISGNERLVGITNGFIATGQNLGGISVAMISGRIIDSVGFDVLSIVYSCFGLAIVACCIFLFIGLKSK